ncbi:MAG TPA: DUF302 domain-containing protein [Solirubrobacteraceae bacterium]|jgi:uncharacterized protein (DUF302 family)|nr:DUF302 domain-containing protein [Solirubrobacteraceae bacterium]
MSLTVSDSPHSVAETIDRLLGALERRKVQVFARIDHAAGARDAGLELADEQLLIFGDPRVGTVLMQSDRAIGYELPLRVLAWEQAGQTKVGYRRPSELADDYAVADRSEVLERMDSLLGQLVAESVATS